MLEKGKDQSLVLAYLPGRNSHSLTSLVVSDYLAVETRAKARMGQ